MSTLSLVLSLLAFVAPIAGWSSALVAVSADADETLQAVLLAATVVLGAIALVSALAALACGIVARSLARTEEKTVAVYVIVAALCVPVTWALEWLVVGSSAVAWFVAE